MEKDYGVFLLFLFQIPTNESGDCILYNIGVGRKPNNSKYQEKETSYEKEDSSLGDRYCDAPTSYSRNVFQ